MRSLPIFFAFFAVAPSACLSTFGTRTRDLLVPPTLPGTRAYVDELVAAAYHKRLGQSAQWLRLGHWRTTWTGAIESEADGDNFFLSPRGKEDPLAELEATLRGFFSDLAPFDAKAPQNQNVQHPMCQFPARLLYLGEALHIDPARLPHPDCARYRDYLTSLRPRGATLVFSSYYLNNPASAFGHTFLRISKANDGIAEDRRQLLDFGIDYAATVDTDFAPVYAFKGIFGLFPGVFSKMPFYYKVREYNDFESRDMWEYQVALTDRQLEMLVAHIWELGSTYFRYYYITANCSYHILGLFEVAIPELSLLDGLHTPVLPADTVKALTGVPGLVKSVNFRPSLRTQFRARIAGLSDEQRAAVEALASHPDHELTGFSDRQRIQIFDAAEDLVDLRYAAEIIRTDRDNTADKLKQRLLERRAEVLVPSEEPAQAIPWHTMPQVGHGSRRLALGAGADRDGGRWLELGARLALHGLDDPPIGFPELAELEFLPLRIRWDLVGHDVEVEQLDLVHIRSLTGQDRFDRHVSWEARLGSERANLECACLAFHLQLGGGATLSFLDEAVAAFLLVESHMWIAPALDGIEGSAFGLGSGPLLGLRVRLGRSLVALATAEWLYLPDQGPRTRFRAEGTLRWALLRDLALDLSGGDQEGRLAGTLSTSLYF